MEEYFQDKKYRGCHEIMRFLRYDPKNRNVLAPHFDGTAAGTDGKTKSLVTAHLYLNEGFKGGSTRFYNSKTGLEGKKSKDFVDVVPKTGSISIF